jgi:hypothetical protein
MPLPFEGVREQLLRAGIAPRHASRYVTELREHLADLTERQRASGLDAAQAAARAMALVGTDADLAQAMIAKDPRRSLAARAPWLVFTVSPVVLWAALIWTIDSSMIRLLWPVGPLTDAARRESYLGLIEVAGFSANYLLGPLLAAGCITVALRQRLRSPAVWVGLALVALLSGLLGFHMNAMSYSAVGLIYVDGRVSPAATFAVAGLRAAVLFGFAAVVYRTLRMRAVPVAA